MKSFRKLSEVKSIEVIAKELVKIHAELDGKDPQEKLLK